MITFDHVTKKYRTNVGLDDVSVKIEKGDFVFLVGPSGAGKSTFIKLILREIKATRGTIKVGDFEVTSLSNREVPIFRRKLGTVFQDFRLLPKKTVYENVAFAMEVVHKTPRQIRKQVPQVLSLVGISDKAHKYPDELSAGEQQRVAIARAIVNNPQVLIADEPTGNLDPDTAWEIMDLLEQINLRGTTIVMVTHAKNIVDQMNKRVIAIEAGKIVRDETGAYGYDADESGFDYYDEEDGQAYDKAGAVFGSNDVDTWEEDDEKEETVTAEAESALAGTYDEETSEDADASDNAAAEIEAAEESENVCETAEETAGEISEAEESCAEADKECEAEVQAEDAESDEAEAAEESEDADAEEGESDEEMISESVEESVTSEDADESQNEDGEENSDEESETVSDTEEKTEAPEKSGGLFGMFRGRRKK